MGGDTESEHALTFRRDERGVVWITWPAGITITGDMAQDGMDQLGVFNGGQKQPVIVEMVGVVGLTREGRKVFTGDCAASRMALLGNKPVERVLANFALAVGRHTVPIRFFTAEEAAVEWLLHDRPTA
jgi:hypothetical protein